MARAVTGPGAIETIEEAIHVLRGGGLRGWALIWTGAVPLAIGLLFFWRDLTRYDRSIETCAWESLLLVGLLLWLNICRGSFAAYVHAQLTGKSDLQNAALFVLRSGVYLLLGNCKLLAMPIAAAAILPLPGTVAFFRIATTVAAVDRSEFFQTATKARKLSGSISQSPLLVLFIGFIAIVLFANFGAALALLPQLVRILTGYESSFTRAGFRLATDPTFYIVAGLLTWLAYEPLVQAIYTVAAFHADSKETGQDVRVRFREVVRQASAALVLLALSMAVLKADTAIDPIRLDQAVKQTLASPEYVWSLQHKAAAPEHESSFVRFTDDLVARLSKLLAAIARGIERFIVWLRDLFKTPAAVQREGQQFSGAIRTTLYIAVALVLVLAGLLIWHARIALARKHLTASAPPQTVSLTTDDITADQLPEAGWYALGDDCLANAEFRLGLRALYLANLAALAHDGWIVIHPGKTNLEYEAELRRRARAFPNACRLFSANLRLFERVWYGEHFVTLEDCQGLRQRTARMKEEMSAVGVTA